MEIVVRKAKEEDIPFLGEIAAAGFSPKTRVSFGKDLTKTAAIFSDFFRIGFFPCEHTVVATVGGKVAGFSTVKFEDKGFPVWKLSQIFRKRLGILGGLRALLILLWLYQEPFDEKTQVFWEMLAVHEDYRSMGIGTKIIQETYSYSLTTGRREILGFVVRGNRAEGLYRRLGMILEPPNFRLAWLSQLLYNFRGYHKLIWPLKAEQLEKTGTRD
ncbi:MAG: N-acetyltransferase family protein [Bacteroidota bacterium]